MSQELQTGNEKEKANEGDEDNTIAPAGVITRKKSHYIYSSNPKYF